MTNVTEGIRVTVEFDSPQGCPITGLSKRASASSNSVPSSVRAEAAAEGVTEFSMEPAAVESPDAVPIFSHGDVRRYRVQHEEGTECPCRSLGRLGCPVDQYVPEDGDLTLVFYASDHEEAQTVLDVLRSRYRMAVKRVEQSPAHGRFRDEALVDRGRLTDRQLEVLRTAYEMGYFEYPRRNNATAVAAELDISLSTFGEHLSTAERKLLGDVF